MYKQLVKYGVLVLCAIGFNMAMADDVENPVTQLQTLVNTMQQDVAVHHASLQNNPDQMYQLVQKNLMPAMAVDRMSATALGPKWRTATAEQKQEFITQFSLMLTRAYVSGLLKVNNYTIVINPLRTDAWKTATILALPGVITNKANGESSGVTYYMVRSGNEWKVYDFAVEGVSIMQNFQSQLQSFSTIAAVITRIKEVNAGSV
jgi:phospholipid transport system substrate-binding protein